MKRWTAAMLALLLLVTAACGAVPGENPEKWEIVVISADAAGDFTAALDRGVRAYSKPRDRVNAYVSMEQYPPELQVPLIEDFIAQEVDAICVFPAPGQDLDPMLQKARDHGIAVLTCGGEGLTQRDLDVEPGENPDPALLGQVLAALAVQVLEGAPLEGEISLDVEGCPAVTLRPGTATVEADCQVQ